MPEPILTVAAPEAELSDAAIRALAALLIDLAEKEEQETMPARGGPEPA